MRGASIIAKIFTSLNIRFGCVKEKNHGEVSFKHPKHHVFIDSYQIGPIF